MGLDVTKTTRDTLKQISLEPQLVLEIEDVSTIYGYRNILKYVRIGDPGLLIGNSWKIGGYNSVDDQETFLSMSGTSNEVNQQLTPDKAFVASVSSVQVTLVDKGDQITELISPGIVVPDMLGRRCKLYMGFVNSAWPEDYVVAFRGIVDDILSDNGAITFNLAHPDQKKRQEIFRKVDAKLTQIIGADDSSETITCVADSADSLNGKYLLAYRPIGDAFAFYFKTSGASISEPVLSGVINVKVNINTNATSSEVAEALMKKIKDTIGFNASRSSNVVTAVHTESGAYSPTADGNGTGFGFASTSGTLTIYVDDTTGFLTPVNGPSGSNDTSLKFYLRINDEIIRYTGKTATTFTGCIRAGETGNTDITGNVAGSHNVGDTATSFYRLEGTGIDLALKLMLSGWNGYFKTGVDVTSFERISSTESVDNAIFFFGIDVAEKYGLTIGDYITTVSASNGANNVTLKEILDIVQTDDGSYLVIDGVTFVYEADSPGTISFRSKYDTLGEGLKMYPDEVDVEQHETIQTRFLSSLDCDFYLKDTINGKDFINERIYYPSALYSVPRKSKASVQYHISPIPGAEVVTLNQTNVERTSKIRLRRTTEKNFYNHIIYKYDEDAFEDAFRTNRIYRSEDSLNQIARGAKALIIEAFGMRSDLGSSIIAQVQANRRLRRYEFACEFMEGIEVKPKVGYRLEVGDIVLFDGTTLSVSDTKTGVRGMTTRFFEIVNRKFNIKTGAVVLSLMDTSFATANRYALIGPSSQIKTGLSTTQSIIEHGDFSDPFGTNEGEKWSRFADPQVRVRKVNYSSQSTSIQTAVSGNTVTVDPALGFTPAAGDIYEISAYSGQTDQVKNLYGHMRDSAFGDGKAQYKML